ncbi:OLC1v1004864C1 [Oldenlandia corymbosa var. corymbosa]|uniref:OLC1v1004864C1 n=1 Tax=Oldenlandia corymbosa var. corymbosa TaxID=529605 RepID=A0AAV1DD95_OLDCO|nr:OLC1v1004864C1 [Oldenlandia corymbosa var. corymbosa]
MSSSEDPTVSATPMASSETPTVFATPMASSEIPEVDSHNQNYPENPISGSATHNVSNSVETHTPVLDSEKQHHAEKPLAGNQTPPNVDQTFPTGSAQRYIADINGLVPTKTIHFHIVVRVMTIWKMIENKNKNVKSVELALIDAQGSKIQATIPARIMKDFQKYFLQEGCARKISRFDHCLNISGGYQCSKHEYKIVFRPDTIVQSVGYHDIPNHVFEFTPFAEITNFVANFDFCFDLLGHIIGYSDPIIDNGKKRISVELEDERADRLKVTLWDEHADKVYTMMTNNPDYPVVLIVQYVKCKKYYSKVLITTNLFNGRIFLNDMTIPDIYEYKFRVDQADIRSASIHKISMLSSISGYTNFDEFVRDAEMLTLAGIDDLEQPSGVVVFAKISGLAKEYDWSYIGCSNCNSKVVEIESSAKENLTGGKQRSAFGKGRKVDNEKPVGLAKRWMCKNHGPVSAVAAKLDVSDYNIRNNTSEISVARVTTDADVIRKYLDAVSDDQEIDPELSAEFCHNLTPLSESTAKTAVSCTDDNDMGAPGDETGDSPPPKKHASAQSGEESVKSQPNKRRLRSDLTANIGSRYLLELNPNVANRSVINTQYFRAINWPSEQKLSLVIDDNQKQWKFQIYTQEHALAGFEGLMWEEFHDFYFNHYECVNVILIYTGNQYFRVRVFNKEGYCISNHQNTVSSDTSKGEVDIINYIRSNSDQNTFNVVMTNDVINKGRLEIPWHIVRRLDIQDYQLLILYYDGEPIMSMVRASSGDFPHRFIVQGDLQYMMTLKRILTGIKLGFRINAQKAANKESLILEVLKQTLDKKRNRVLRPIRYVKSKVPIRLPRPDLLTAKISRYQRKNILYQRRFSLVINNHSPVISNRERPFSGKGSRLERKKHLDKKKGKVIHEEQHVTLGGIVISHSNNFTGNVFRNTFSPEIKSTASANQGFNSNSQLHKNVTKVKGTVYIPSLPFLFKCLLYLTVTQTELT